MNIKRNRKVLLVNIFPQTEIYTFIILPHHPAQKHHQPLCRRVFVRRTYVFMASVHASTDKLLPKTIQCVIEIGFVVFKDEKIFECFGLLINPLEVSEELCEIFAVKCTVNACIFRSEEH